MHVDPLAIVGTVRHKGGIRVAILERERALLTVSVNGRVDACGKHGLLVIAQTRIGLARRLLATHTKEALVLARAIERQRTLPRQRHAHATRATLLTRITRTKVGLLLTIET